MHVPLAPKRPWADPMTSRTGFPCEPSLTFAITEIDTTDSLGRLLGAESYGTLSSVIWASYVSKKSGEQCQRSGNAAVSSRRAGTASCSKTPNDTSSGVIGRSNESISAVVAIKQYRGDRSSSCEGADSAEQRLQAGFRELEKLTVFPKAGIRSIARQVNLHCSDSSCQISSRAHLTPHMLSEPEVALNRHQLPWNRSFATAQLIVRRKLVDGSKTVHILRYLRALPKTHVIAALQRPHSRSARHKKTEVLVSYELSPL